MAQRRMVSVKIIDSAKFIKMPVSTQALYFHLIARADDDGIVEAFNVMRMTGASEDDLKVLCAKEFVKVLNEDMVAFITDWHEHNLIRSDRKIDSMYQHLLLQVVPEVELKEKKERADRRKLLVDGNGTSQGQPEDGIGKVRLGQGSEGKKEKTFLYNSIEVRLSEHLFSRMKINNPTAKEPNWQVWARSIDLMMRVDGRTEDDIVRMIDWCQKDNFWKGNILSTAKLREKYDQLNVRMNQEEPQKPKIDRSRRIS